ncbi:MAG: helix-turn-helix domain-containing protein [Agathobacter sp.]
MNNNFNIGERVRELRIQEGLSQEQLALRAEITPAYLGLIERNAKNPTVKIIEQICNALSVSLSEFFTTHSFPNSPLDPVSFQILSQITNRSKEEKQLILQLVKNTLNLRDLP